MVRHREVHRQELAELLAPHLPAPLTLGCSGVEFVEITGVGVDKSRALAGVVGEWDADAGDVIAFGDNHNDMQMLRWAGHGVAVSNAVDAAKGAADEVIGITARRRWRPTSSGCSRFWPMTDVLRWGIASTGMISNSMAGALASIDAADVVAVGSRTQAAADEFAATHSIARAHGSYEALWDDPDVDVVYIGSPHSEHHWMTLAALAHGKHVLCEKAFALNVGQAREMIDAARRHDRFLMEAMWSWFMPTWHELRSRIADGAIGEVISIDANFAIPILDENGRHRRPDLAGGALLDLGIYPLSIGRFLLGEPVEVKALGRLTSQGVDGLVGGVMRHGSGAVTTFTTSIDAMSDLTARVVGTEGIVVVAAPFWFPTEFTITRHDGSGPERVEIPNRGLAHEAEHVGEQIRSGRVESDIQTWDATLANMELMDEIRRQLGVVYPSEVEAI